tara:strand:- start:41 stop:1015 length:975 start_codon:yes stop_codon:yes gene_type:complete
MRKILVTGGAGYIGSHACKELSRAGYLPVSFDNLSNGHKKAVKWGPLIIGNINNSNQLNKVFTKYKPLAVMHFAGCISVGESEIRPSKYYKNNVKGTLSLLNVMKKFSVKYMVYSSSGAVYGKTKKNPIKETAIKKPTNPYGWSKLISEKMILRFSDICGIKFAILRYFNASGADKLLDIGECHKPETHLIPLVLKAALKKNNSIKIFGNNYKTKDGTCIRDYIHVSDLAKAHVLSLNKIIKDKKSFHLNLGTGKGYSVKEIIDLAKKITNKEIKVNIFPRRKGDIPEMIADSKKAKRILNWKIKNSDIKTILETAWNWHKKQI